MSNARTRLRKRRHKLRREARLAAKLLETPHQRIGSASLSALIWGYRTDTDGAGDERERAAAAASMLQFDMWLVEASESIGRALARGRDEYNNAMRDDLNAAGKIKGTMSRGGRL